MPLMPVATWSRAVPASSELYSRTVGCRSSLSATSASSARWPGRPLRRLRLPRPLRFSLSRARPRAARRKAFSRCSYSATGPELRCLASLSARPYKGTVGCSSRVRLRRLPSRWACASAAKLLWWATKTARSDRLPICLRSPSTDWAARWRWSPIDGSPCASSGCVTMAGSRVQVTARPAPRVTASSRCSVAEGRSNIWYSAIPAAGRLWSTGAAAGSTPSTPTRRW